MKLPQRLLGFCQVESYFGYYILKKKLFEKKICNSSLYDFIYMVFFNKGAFKFYNLILIYEYRGPEFYKIMEL